MYPEAKRTGNIRVLKRFILFMAKRPGNIREEGRDNS
jgi:hypothetical protein